MSIFSKFTSLFSETETTVTKKSIVKDQLLEVFGQILNPDTKFNVEENSDLLAQFLLESENHIAFLFDFLEKISSDLNPISIIQLLAVVHRLLKYQGINQAMAIEIRGATMPWMHRPEYFDQTEQEISTRRSTLRIHTEIDNPEPNPIFLYAQQCYGYLQRIALNLDLYLAIHKSKYPYIKDQDDVEPRLMFLWNYKIQNMMNYATQLLHYDSNLLDIQIPIYNDMLKCQNFVCESIYRVIELYANLPNSDALNLFENYTESNRHYEILLNFHNKTITSTKAPSQCVIQKSFLQEFLQFISKLKVLNQFAFKKSIKVPNKNNPCLGMQKKHTKIVHLKTESGILKSDGSNSDSEDQLEELLSFEMSKKPKRIFLKGQSTFQV